MKQPLVAYLGNASIEAFSGERDALTAVGAAFEVRFAETEAEVRSALRGVSVVWVSQQPITAEAIESASYLVGIVRLGVGVDTVDIPAATTKGLPVINFPDYCRDEVAEHTIMLMLACSRRMPQALSLVADGEWPRGGISTATRLGSITCLAGKTLGVVGLGGIGRRVVQIGHSLGMRLIGTDPRFEAETRVGQAMVVSFEDLIRQADVLTLHVPLSPSTRHLIGRRQLAAMKPGAILVNTSRGGLVDQDALVAAVRSRHLAAAGLDVLSVEPPPAGDSVLSLPDVIVTPHMAYYSDESAHRLLRSAVDATIQLLRGDMPETTVNGRELVDRVRQTRRLGQGA
jgi:D-3-phosphoglycerate dehydrogenase